MSSDDERKKASRSLFDLDIFSKKPHADDECKDALWAECCHPEKLSKLREGTRGLLQNLAGTGEPTRRLDPKPHVEELFSTLDKISKSGVSSKREDIETTKPSTVTNPDYISVTLDSSEKVASSVKGGSKCQLQCHALHSSLDRCIQDEIRPVVQNALSANYTNEPNEESTINSREKYKQGLKSGEKTEEHIDKEEQDEIRSTSPKTDFSFSKQKEYVDGKKAVPHGNIASSSVAVQHPRVIYNPRLVRHDGQKRRKSVSDWWMLHATEMSDGMPPSKRPRTEQCPGSPVQSVETSKDHSKVTHTTKDSPTVVQISPEDKEVPESDGQKMQDGSVTTQSSSASKSEIFVRGKGPTYRSRNFTQEIAKQIVKSKASLSHDSNRDSGNNKNCQGTEGGEPLQNSEKSFLNQQERKNGELPSGVHEKCGDGASIVKGPQKSVAKVNNKHDKLLSETKFFMKMGKDLNLSAEVIARAKKLLRRAVKKRLNQRGLWRTYQDILWSACLCLACRQEGCPRSFHELSLFTGRKKRDIGGCFKVLVDVLHVNPGCMSTKDFVVRYSSLVRLNDEDTDAALAMAEKIQERDDILSHKRKKFGSMSPMAVASISVFMIANNVDSKSNLSFALSDLSKLLGRGESSFSSDIHLIFEASFISSKFCVVQGLGEVYTLKGGTWPSR